MTLAQKDKDPGREERLILENCLFAFIFFGVGQAISGFLMGKLIDSTSSKTACLFNILMMVLVMITSVINVNKLEYGWISYITLFLWGIQDSFINTHTYQMLGFEFES